MVWIHAAAVATRRRRNEREEKDVIERLSGSGTHPQCEFKVLRSYGSIFSNEGRLKSILQKEARAGWELAAKLDGRRLVLRRHISRRASDAQLEPGPDPYRTVVDPESPLIVVVVIVAFVVTAALLSQSSVAPTQAILGFVAAIGLALALATAMTRLR